VGARTRRQPRLLARRPNARPRGARARPAGPPVDRPAPGQLGARRPPGPRRGGGQRAALRLTRHARLGRLVRTGLPRVRGRRGGQLARAARLGHRARRLVATHRYLTPGADSLAATWARVLDPLVQPSESLPAALRSQLPYPRQAFRIAAALVTPARTDSAAWLPRPRDPFEVVAPVTEAGAETRVWTAQGFETGTPREVTALVAATIGPQGPELFAWRPSPTVRLPGVLVGSPQPPTAPGVLRLWNVGGLLFSAQALFNEPVSGGPPAGIDAVFLTWSDRRGQGATPWAALRDLLAAGRGEHLAADTSLAARWQEARRLAAQADAALAAGDLEAFGRYYR